MRRVITFFVLIAMAVALNLLIQRCSRDTRLIAQKQEHAEETERVCGFFKPDTASDIRFGHSKSQTDETRNPSSIRVEPWPFEAFSPTTATP